MAPKVMKGSMGMPGNMLIMTIKKEDMPRALG